MYVIDMLTKVLACVGAINWGLIALFEFNLVTALFGASAVTQVVYILVGISGLYQLFNTFRTIAMTQGLSTHSNNS